MKSGIGLLIICPIMLACMQTPCVAEVSSSETFTVTIPETIIIELNSQVHDFGELTVSEFGTSDTSKHVITVGDGTTNTSYVKTNCPQVAEAKQYKLSFNGNGNSAAKIEANENCAKLILTGEGNTSIIINLTDITQNAYPKLGSGDGISFTVQDESSLQIPASSGVKFENQTAGLNMKMDLDEGSLSPSAAPQIIGFDVVLSVVGG